MNASVSRQRFRALVHGVLLSLLLASPQVDAETLIGGGLARYAIDAGHPSIGRVDAGGVYLALYQHATAAPLGFALTLGGSSGFDVDAVDTDYDPFYPADRAEYGFIDLALRLFPTLQRLQPSQAYFALGWGLHSVNWTRYVFDQTGEGLSLGMGVLIPLNPDWCFELGLNLTYYRSSQYFFTSGDGVREDNQVVRAGLGLLYRFDGF